MIGHRRLTADEIRRLSTISEQEKANALAGFTRIWVRKSPASPEQRAADLAPFKSAAKVAIAIIGVGLGLLFLVMTLVFMFLLMWWYCVPR